MNKYDLLKDLYDSIKDIIPASSANTTLKLASSIENVQVLEYFCDVVRFTILMVSSNNKHFKENLEVYEYIISLISKVKKENVMKSLSMFSFALALDIQQEDIKFLSKKIKNNQVNSVKDLIELFSNITQKYNTEYFKDLLNEFSINNGNQIVKIK